MRVHLVIAVWFVAQVGDFIVIYTIHQSVRVRNLCSTGAPSNGRLFVARFKRPSRALHHLKTSQVARRLEILAGHARPRQDKDQREPDDSRIQGALFRGFLLRNPIAFHFR